MVGRSVDVRATTAATSGGPVKERVPGVDVARGVALFSMLAANIYDATVGVVDDGGQPTLAGMTVTGRSATLFVMVAGISLAFITGGQRPVQGRDRRASAVGLAVRALLIGAIGLALGYGSPELIVILPYYGLFFLLAIPFVGLRPRTLACIAGGLVAAGPLLLLGATSLGLEPVVDGSLTFGDALTDPIGFIIQLFVTGYFPAVVYMAYIFAGLAIGRLDLSSTRVAARLLVGGLVLAVTAWVTSSLLLFNLGGLQHLITSAEPNSDPATVGNEILWDAERMSSWWWLAVRSHHSGTPIDALHTLGTAIAVLGAVLLITKLRAARSVLWPVGVAGAMTLTIYSAHVLVLGSGLLSDDPLALFVVSTAAALAFAVVWRRLVGQGPLERFVAVAAGWARRTTTRLLEEPTSPTGVADGRTQPVLRNAVRGSGRLLRPLAIAAVLALAFWVGARVVSDVSAAEAPGVVAGPAPALPAPSAGSAGAPPALAAAPVPDVDRYCELSEQLYALDDAHPDQPGVVVQKAATQLNEMPQVAPAEIRDAVTTVVNDYRAEAGAP
ncbi:MAG TPA: heparan-alpha-glucosaminide N-acetyltransferase domain-containing protein, partial [Propionibacteriaceae bacterium]|nr:heparan-alpha-glucosaminide N-acetyltransferase domain-containing protein [Propionibacteriaceae bacterium]